MERGRRPIGWPSSITWYCVIAFYVLVLHVGRVHGTTSDEDSTGSGTSANLLPPLRFLTEPESVIIWANFTGSVTLPCVADPPEADVRWTLNGDDDVSGHSVEPGSIRFAPPPSGSWSDFEMLGGGDRVYRCLATSQAGTIVSKEAVVSLARIAPFTNERGSSQNVTVLEGNTAVITCTTPRGHPEPVIEFERNGRRIRIGERQRILPSGTLQIVRANGKKDDGIYRCSAVNRVSGERLDAPNTSNLRVITAPSTSSSSSTHRSMPRFSSSPPSSVTAVVGGNATLECAADGWPTPRVNWTGAGRVNLDQDGRHSAIFGNLVISNVQKSDEGLYLCHASNAAGNQTAATSLVVHEPPVITVPPVDHVTTEGSAVTLRCDVMGTPTPSVQWFHNAVPISASDSVRIVDSSLSFASIPTAAAGMYQCFATNIVGAASSSAQLIVNVRPTTTTFSTIPTSMPTKGRKTDVVNYASTLRGDEPARSQRQRARTKSTTPFPSSTSPIEADYVEIVEQPVTYDEAVPTVDPLIPSKVKPDSVAVPGTIEPPPLPEAVQLSDTSVQLQWTGVLSNVSLPVVFYKIQYQEVATSGNGRKSRWITVDDEFPPNRLQFEVKDLKPGLTYQFRLAAVYSNQDNKNGPSKRLTLVSSSAPRRQRGPVGIITIVELRALPNGSMSVGWQYETTDPADRVDGFLILYKEFSGDEDRLDDYQSHTVSDARLRRAEISGLLPDTSYSFRMKCYNGAGQSEMSNAFVKKTLESSPDSEQNLLVPSELVPLSSTSRPEFVYVPNRLSTQASNELLFVVLGVVLGSTVVTLFGIMCACACQQRRRKRILAARRGETKFHDPARSIYLNTLSKTRTLNGGGNSGFMLKNIDSGPGNRLAVNGGQDPRYSSGRWSSLVDAHPTSNYNDHSLDSKFFAEQPTLLKEHGPMLHSAAPSAPGGGDYSLERPTGSKTSLTRMDAGDQKGIVAEVVTADGTSDVGLIERPRDMAASSSSSTQHLPSSRSAARAVGGCSDAGSRQSSSLNRDRRTSPDHIPRLHECWSLEPVRRATNRNAGSRGATEPSSELSSLDSLPTYTGHRNTSNTGFSTDNGEEVSIANNLQSHGNSGQNIESRTERVQRVSESPSAFVEAAKSSRTLPPETIPFSDFLLLGQDDLCFRDGAEQSNVPVESDFLLSDGQY